MQALFNKLEEELKRKKLTSSHLVAQKISEFFYQYIKHEGEKSPGEVLQQVKQFGEKLKNADQNNFVVPNMVKRVLHIIRETCRRLKLEKQLK